MVTKLILHSMYVYMVHKYVCMYILCVCISYVHASRETMMIAKQEFEALALLSYLAYVHAIFVRVTIHS